MHIEFFVEELSAEAALQNLVPKILGFDVSFSIHPHQGKPDLRKKLPGRLAGYKHWLPDDWRIVVLMDEDRADCRDLKNQLEEISHNASFITKSSASEGRQFQVLNRLAIEELEAWFFGDVPALTRAYPRIPVSLGQQARYCDPDAIAGGTWESLERLLQRRGYHPGGLPKVAAAREISRHMDPQRNRSKSFQVFRDGLVKMISQHVTDS